jgi:DNA-directed RNA polymerase subunit RPC12/RpoP
MDPWYDLINYELCFPGSVTGSTEVECPLCGELLTVPVDDPMRKESYQCCKCSRSFDVDWGDGTITPWAQIEIQINTDGADD